MINGLQIKLARTAIGWGVRDLAEQSGISFNTVSRFENGAGVQSRTIQALQSTLEDAGVIFINEGAQSLEGGSGIRLKG